MSVVNNVGIEGPTKKKRIFYFDALRALAILAVIGFHTFKRAHGVIDDPSLFFSTNWFINDIWGNCLRCGVDIFLMLSGALSLGRVWDIKSFLGRRIPRIVKPFLFWGFVLSVLLTVIYIFYPDFVSVTVDNFMDFLYLLKCAYKPDSYYFGQYWFFWMILGTYLIMPIFNKWLLNCDLKEVEYFLVLWLVTCVFDYTLLRPCPVKLSYFSGPIGMVILGYYLRHTKRKLFNNPYFALLLTILAPLVIVITSSLLSTPKDIFYIERYSIFMAFEVMGIFLLFKNFDKFNININFFNNPNGIFRKGVFSIAKYSYGIYLVHQCLMNFFKDALVGILPYKSLLVVVFIGTLVSSWALLAVLNRVPYVNQWIGAK